MKVSGWEFNIPKCHKRDEPSSRNYFTTWDFDSGISQCQIICGFTDQINYFQDKEKRLPLWRQIEWVGEIQAVIRERKVCLSNI